MPQLIGNTLLGTGHCLGSACSATGIAVIALAVAAVASALLIWDGMFLYSYAQKSLAHLLWCVPMTLLFVAIDGVFISAVSGAVERPTTYLAGRIKEHHQGMCSHYRAAWSDA